MGAPPDGPQLRGVLEFLSQPNPVRQGAQRREGRFWGFSSRRFSRRFSGRLNFPVSVGRSLSTAAGLVLAELLELLVELNEGRFGLGDSLLPLLALGCEQIGDGIGKRRQSLRLAGGDPAAISSVRAAIPSRATRVFSQRSALA